MAWSNGGTLEGVTAYADRKQTYKISVPIKTSSNPGVDMLQQAMNNNQKTLQDFSKYKDLKNAGVTNVSRSQFHTLKGEKGKATVAKVGEGIKSGVGTIGSALGSEAGNAAMDMIAGMIPDKGKNTSFKEQQQIGNYLMKANPVVGGVYKAASILGELTGTNVSKMNSEQASAAGISKGTKFLNNAASYIPGVGILGSTTMDAEKSHLIDSMSGAYSGAVADIDTAGTMAGKNYLFGKRAANQFIATMNERNKIMTNIQQTNTLRKQSDYGIDLAQQNLNRYAGTNYMDMRMGKQGMKFDTLDEIKLMLANRKQVKEVEKFANGGLIEGANLMPTGQLHARLHHMEDHNPELASNLTKKGIPVVALNEGGELEQVAEIEHSELIFSGSLTEKLEELRKDGSEEAMIEAGKILVEEILFNTKDEGGVINE